GFVSRGRLGLPNAPPTGHRWCRSQRHMRPKRSMGWLMKTGASANLPSQERARVDIDGAPAPPIAGAFLATALPATLLASPPAEMACVSEAAAASAVALRPLIMTATSAPGVLDPLASSLSSVLHLYGAAPLNPPAAVQRAVSASQISDGLIDPRSRAPDPRRRPGPSTPSRRRSAHCLPLPTPQRRATALKVAMAFRSPDFSPRRCLRCQKQSPAN